MAATIPDFQDKVKHNLGIMGTVIATYKKGGIDCLDVRSADEKCIYYGSPAVNWTVIRTREEIEGEDAE